MAEAKPMDFTLKFDPSRILKDAEEQLTKSFRNQMNREIEVFCDGRTTFGNNGPKKIPGAGQLLIQDFLQKKFDDPATLAKMEEYFDKNFDRIMGEAMEKALQHKANKFAFAKANEARSESQPHRS